MTADISDELNIPTHRWYVPRNHIPLPAEDVTRSLILASGINKIDAHISSLPPWEPFNEVKAMARSVTRASTAISGVIL